MTLLKAVIWAMPCPFSGCRFSWSVDQFIILRTLPFSAKRRSWMCHSRTISFDTRGALEWVPSVCLGPSSCGKEQAEAGALRSAVFLLFSLNVFVIGATQLNSQFHNHHLDTVTIKNNTIWLRLWLLIGLWKEPQVEEMLQASLGN